MKTIQLKREIIDLALAKAKLKLEGNEWKTKLRDLMDNKEPITCKNYTFTFEVVITQDKIDDLLCEYATLAVYP